MLATVIIMLLDKSVQDFFFVKGFILLFSRIALLSLIYVIFVVEVSGVQGLLYPFTILVAVFGSLELLWYALWFLPYRAVLQAPGYKPVPLNRTERKKLFKRMLEHTPDIEQYIRKWARQAHVEDIRRDNVKDWLLWQLFDRDGRPGPDNVELEDYIDMLEKNEQDMRIKPGRGEAKPLRAQFDAVRMAHRSLSYYGLIGLVDLYTSIALLSRGFTFYRQPRMSFFKTFPFRSLTVVSAKVSASPRISYFYRPHTSTTHRPVLFLHGIGIGLLPYLPFLSTLARDVGILAIELLPISNRVSQSMLTTTALVQAIVTILQQHSAHFDDFVLVAHSYGTFLVGPLLRSPELSTRISRIVLVDPCALLLHLPDFTYALSRRKPRFAGEWQTWWLAARDPRVAHTLARRFAWRENILWREDLQTDTMSRRTTVVVAGRDSILNPMAMASYAHFGDVRYSEEDVDEWKATAVEWSGNAEMELLWLDGLDHGQVFARKKERLVLKDVVDSYCLRDDRIEAARTERRKTRASLLNGGLQGTRFESHPSPTEPDMPKMVKTIYDIPPEARN